MFLSLALALPLALALALVPGPGLAVPGHGLGRGLSPGSGPKAIAEKEETSKVITMMSRVFRTGLPTMGILMSSVVTCLTYLEFPNSVFTARPKHNVVHM